MTLAHRQAAFLSRILGEDVSRLSAGERAYHHAYRSRLTDALGDTFEQTWGYLGDETFWAAAQAFISHNPSSTWTLDAYGAAFPAYLATYFPENPEVADLAWIDGALRRAFAGPDADPLQPAKLVAADWDRARLVLVPTLAFGAVTTNAGAIWRALGAGEAPPQPTRLSRTAQIAVWRHGFEPCYRTLEPDEGSALSAIAAGETFAEVCDRLLAARVDDATEVASRWPEQWIRDGIVCDVV